MVEYIDVLFHLFLFSFSKPFFPACLLPFKQADAQEAASSPLWVTEGLCWAPLTEPPMEPSAPQRAPPPVLLEQWEGPSPAHSSALPSQTAHPWAGPWEGSWRSTSGHYSLFYVSRTPTLAKDSVHFSLLIVQWDSCTNLGLGVNVSPLVSLLHHIH